MSALVDLLWVGGGAFVGTPISAAMGTLPARNTEGGVSLRRARILARRATDWRIREWLTEASGPPARTRRSSSQNDEPGIVIVYGALVVVAVAIYARNAVPISVTMFWLSVLCILITTLVFTVLSVRRVF